MSCININIHIMGRKPKGGKGKSHAKKKRKRCGPRQAVTAALAPPVAPSGVPSNAEYEQEPVKPVDPMLATLEDEGDQVLNLEAALARTRVLQRAELREKAKAKRRLMASTRRRIGAGDADGMGAILAGMAGTTGGKKVNARQQRQMQRMMSAVPEFGMSNVLKAYNMPSDKAENMMEKVMTKMQENEEQKASGGESDVAEHEDTDDEDSGASEVDLDSDGSDDDEEEDEVEF